MQLVDVLAIALVIAAGAAFVFGEGALARAEDLRAVYWLVIGVVTLRAAVQVARPGART
jgi:type IV secretory pathway VirB2 component (pilin)